MAKSRKTRVLSISLPSDMDIAIKERAKNERRSTSEVLREAIRKYLLFPIEIPQNANAGAGSYSARRTVR